MGRALWIIVGLSAVGYRCTSPELEGTQWRCSSNEDCLEDFLCAQAAGICVSAISDANGVTRSRIQVGMTAPLSAGPTAVGQSMRDGIETYFSSVNDSGGVDGRRIELMAMDDGNDASRALANVEVMIDSGDVFAFVGNVGLNTAAATEPVAIRRRVIQFGAFGGSTQPSAELPSRYLFYIRPELSEEIRQAVQYVVESRTGQVRPENIALFTEGEGDMDELGVYGQSGLDALRDVLSNQYEVDPASVIFATHDRNTVALDRSVAALLKWIGSGDREYSDDVRLRVGVVLASHAQPSALFVKQLIDEVNRIQSGAAPSPQLGLDVDDVTQIQNLDELVFVAVSMVGGTVFADELEGLGEYATAEGARAYCDGVVTTQVVPDYRGLEPGLAEYRRDFDRYRPDVDPGFVSLEGYLAARTFVEGLRRHGPAIETESLIDTFDNSGDFDVGTGRSYRFTPNDRDGSVDVSGTQLNQECVHEPIDLERRVGPPLTAPCDDGRCTPLTGTIAADLTLTADQPWLLQGLVTVGDGVNTATLTIEAGARIFAASSASGLVVNRNAKIMASGTRAAPIVFSSGKASGTRAAGDWVGVAVNGRAPVNGCENPPCELTAGDGTTYGGDEQTDDSGILRFVRIEFAGSNDSDGLSLRGVGAMTTVDFVQIHRGGDDGVQFDGGQVDVRHVVITGAADDSIDWNFGWRGRGQYVVVQQWPDAADNAIQADNNEQNRDALPRSQPTLSNITLIGVPTSNQSDFGLLFKDGSAGNLSNTIVLGFNRACIDIDDEETFGAAVTPGNELTGALTLSNSIIHCETNFEEEDDDPLTVESFVTDLNLGNRLVDPELSAPYDLSALDARPVADGAAATGAMVPMDQFFEQVDFIGAVDPFDNWLRGWTTAAAN